jgi:hypothetical protein
MILKEQKEKKSLLKKRNFKDTKSSEQGLAALEELELLANIDEKEKSGLNNEN